MNKAKDPWYLDNLNVTTALTLLVAMLALCCWLAPGQSKRATVYQDSNLTIQCIEKKAGTCKRVKVKAKKGVMNDRK